MNSMMFLSKLTCLTMMITMAFQSTKLSSGSQKYIEIFKEMFPNVNIENTKVFDLIRNETIRELLIQENAISCARQHQNHRNHRRFIRSVFKLMEIPLDEEATIPTTAFRDYNTEHYLYIAQSDYDKYNMTSSELAYSKEGWDYSPYVPPGETTTDFIFPSWNYGGMCPAAFFKEHTAGEMDPYAVTNDSIPDDNLGYTDPSIPRCKTFEEAYDTFWNTVFSIRHKCDNYTSLWACLQGPEIKGPSLMDPTDDWID